MTPIYIDPTGKAHELSRDELERGEAPAELLTAHGDTLEGALISREIRGKRWFCFVTVINGAPPLFRETDTHQPQRWREHRAQALQAWRAERDANDE